MLFTLYEAFWKILELEFWQTVHIFPICEVITYRNLLILGSNCSFNFYRILFDDFVDSV